MVDNGRGSWRQLTVDRHLRGPGGRDADTTQRIGTATATGVGPGRAVFAPAAAEPSPVDYQLVDEIRTAVNAALDDLQRDAEARLSAEDQQERAQQLIVDQLQIENRRRVGQGRPALSMEIELAVREAVVSALFGLGRLEPLLADPLVEDIIIVGAREVWLLYADGTRAKAPPVADSDEELLDQLRLIATHLGPNERPVTSTMPWLSMRLPDGSRLSAVWDVTPAPRVVIRKHRFVDITLGQLVDMDTVSPALEAFLTAAVRSRLNILVVGAPGSGKTTLLRGLARCLPPGEMFATVESEYELLLDSLRDEHGEAYWPLLVPFETRPGTGELTVDGRAVGEITMTDLLPVSLRQTVHRVIVGEVRDREVIPMLMNMLRGYPGSMATFHANTAMTAFDGLASLMMASDRTWTRSAALDFLAAALQLIVYVDWVDTDDGPHRYVSDVLQVSGPGEGSHPAVTQLFGPAGDDPRAYPQHAPEGDAAQALRRIGFPMEWLDPVNGSWPRPLPPTRGWSR